MASLFEKLILIKLSIHYIPGMHIILDFIPNHTSDNHTWFLESRASSDRTNTYRSYYVWEGDVTGNAPNNWVSINKSELKDEILLAIKSVYFKVDQNILSNKEVCALKVTISRHICGL